MNLDSAGIVISPEDWALMEADVSTRSPEEACGFVGGEANQARVVIPITNILHDPYRFRMDPDEELHAFMSIERQGWEVIAIYHSHPQGINRPSATDVAELTFPGVIYLIWYQAGGKWECRGYYMAPQGTALEVPLIISTKR